MDIAGGESDNQRLVKPDSPDWVRVVVKVVINWVVVGIRVTYTRWFPVPPLNSSV